MNTPNGPVSAPLILNVEGHKVTGKFARDETRWLDIENGKVNGNEFSLAYSMTGKVKGDTITESP